MRLLLGGGGHILKERRRLLISEIRDFLGEKISSFLFLPYALKNYELSVEEFHELGLHAGYEITPIHRLPDPKKAIKEAEAVCVVGGNTYRLLKTLYDLDLINVLREKVAAGFPYIGISAGAVIACPTVKTSNDMQIVVPPSVAALNLVPFQINPHYTDARPDENFRGETRDRRIQEFLEENSETVIALREGSILRIEDQVISLTASGGGKIFCRDSPPKDVWPDDIIPLLLHGDAELKIAFDKTPING